MGSVKDLRILKKAFENRAGIGLFGFSDRYSVFDWVKMLDSIKGKGKSLAVMAGLNFEELSKRGIESHYRGLESSAGTFRLDSSVKMKHFGSDTMRFDLAVKYMPIAREFIDNGEQRVKYDYSFFENNRGRLNNFLVPLEIIFRNGLPKGSSIFKRLKSAEGDRKKTKQILRELGLKKVPGENSMLPKPVMGYTTKLEEGDRHLSESEAYRISGLTEEDFRKVGEIALKVNDYVSERAEQTGLAPHWDGKVEMIYFNGLKLADVVGTLDEDRFGDRISKEFLRQWYQKNQPEWGKACDEYKGSGEGWQDRCPIKPMRLPERLSTLVSQMYMSACNQYVQREIFPGVPKLDEVMESLKEFRD